MVLPVPLRDILDPEAIMMFKSMKWLLMGMGLTAAAVLAMKTNPQLKQTMEDAAQTVTDKAEDLKNNLGM